MLHDGELAVPADDLRQARAGKLDFLIERSSRGIHRALRAARDLLMPHGDGMIALSTVLRIKRALDGTEIDVLFSDVQARKALAIDGRVANSGRASLRVQPASPGRSCVATTRTRAGQLSIKDALFA